MGKLAGNISAFTKDIPGSEGGKRNLRQRAESTVGRIGEETSIARKMGNAPAYFGTFTSARYQWSSLHKLLEIRDKCDVDFARAAGSTM